jgi:Bestrophin, RFP-TM, chloride channel
MEKIDIPDSYQELHESPIVRLNDTHSRARLTTMSRNSLPPGAVGNMSTVSMESTPFHVTPEHQHFHVFSYSKLGIFDYFTFSILNKIFIPVLLHVLWAILWVVLYTYADVKFIGVVSGLVTVVSVVISLLLVFRTNTAYDRYWEARK